MGCINGVQWASLFRVSFQSPVCRLPLLSPVYRMLQPVPLLRASINTNPCSRNGAVSSLLSMGFPMRTFFPHFRILTQGSRGAITSVLLGLATGIFGQVLICSFIMYHVVKSTTAALTLYVVMPYASDFLPCFATYVLLHGGALLTANVFLQGH